MWWGVWGGGHPWTTLTCDCGDPSSFVWWMGWPAYALSHGQNLLLATQSHVPTGMSTLDNTSQLGLGVLLAPVTWLLGPIAAVNVALTAGPALTALAGYGCLRRAVGLRWPAAFLGGLLYGFSPFMMRNEASTHLQTSFLALLPLICWCCYELLVTQRGRWWRWGIALGLLVAAQFFIGTEMLTVSAISAAIATGLAAGAAALARRRALARTGAPAGQHPVAARLPFAWRGLALAGAITGVLLAYPLWFALAGPQHITGQNWWRGLGNGLMQMILPIGPTAAQRHAWPRGGYLGPVGLFEGYLGVLALVAVLLGAFWVRRPLARLAAAMTVILGWLSLGGYALPLAQGGEPSWLWLPWTVADRLPVLDKLTPANFSGALTWFVALGAALVIDQLWRAEPALAGGRPGRARVLARTGASLAGAALAVPWLLAWHLPLTTETVRTAGWVSHQAASLPAHAVVLFYPFPATWEDQALVWQAEYGMRFAVVGGRGITAGPGGIADHGWTPGTAEGIMTALTVREEPHYYFRLPPIPGPAQIASFRQALRRWGVTSVVMTPGGRSPAYARRWLSTVLGGPPERQDGAWVWDNVQQLAR